MIKINRREDCSGCGACEQICPHNCISLIADGEGYWYPQVEIESCIECHLCERTCPVMNPEEERIPLNVYAAINKDDNIRERSASGGIFTLVAEKVIDQGGVVFGVKFDNAWNVVFDYTETKDGLEKFRRSKYVQAWLGDTYKKVLDFLKKDRLVLFVGTPCQVAGLRRFLKKEHDNLLLMDLLCEGVPSPKVWKMYLEEEVSRQCKKNSVAPHMISNKEVQIKDISFRNKNQGWKLFSFALTLVPKTANDGIDKISYIDRNSAYIQAMFQYLDLRPICYECPFKSCKSHSDITIADYWGINRLHPEMDDNMGTSMVYVNTEKGKSYYDINKTNYIETSYEEAFPYNNVVTSSKRHPNREKFFGRIDNCKSIIGLLDYYKYTRSRRMILGVKRMTKTILPTVIYNYLKQLWKLRRRK